MIFMKAIAFFNCPSQSLKILNVDLLKFFLSGILLVCLSMHTYSQKDTSTVYSHSPKKAAIMSACLPGLGQIYNKKYWKLPIIYAGAATVTYFAIMNSDSMKVYRDAYIFRTDGDSATNTSPYLDYYETSSLLQIKNIYRRNLELTVIVAAAIYALNIIDATVDAYLFDFNIDDNLSMKVSPVMFSYAGNYSPGVSLCFNIGYFKSKHLH